MPRTPALGTGESHQGSYETGGAVLDIPRQSVPSLLVVAGDLLTELRTRYDGEPPTDYFERIDNLAQA